MTQQGERLEAMVHGRVQGVGFRYFVQSHAERLGLAGYTRNLSDGRTVEVVAEGDRAPLDRLLSALHEGPPGSYVEHVSTNWSPATGEFDGFGVRH